MGFFPHSWTTNSAPSQSWKPKWQMWSLAIGVEASPVLHWRGNRTQELLGKSVQLPEIAHTEWCHTFTQSLLDTELSLAMQETNFTFLPSQWKLVLLSSPSPKWILQGRSTAFSLCAWGDLSYSSWNCPVITPAWISPADRCRMLIIPRLRLQDACWHCTVWNS